MAVHGNQIFAGLEGGPAFWCQRKDIVVAVKSTGFERKQAVDVNLGIFIVMQPGADIVEISRRHIHFPPQPDVVRPPSGADDGAWRVACAKPALALLP